MLNSKEEIVNWLRDNNIIREGSNITIHDDLIVDVDHAVDLGDLADDVTELPIQFGEVKGDFGCGMNGRKLNSVKGFPHTIHGGLGCYKTDIRSLAGIDKVVHQVQGPLVFNTSVTHVLGLLLIKGADKIDLDGGKIEEIMNKYMGTGDILSAQDELLDSGFIEQARL